jgi:hypothetical protein
MKKPKPHTVDLEAVSDYERDRHAHNIMLTCVGDLSRQIAEGRMPKQDAPAAIEYIAEFSYMMTDAMRRARGAK